MRQDAAPDEHSGNGLQAVGQTHQDCVDLGPVDALQVVAFEAQAGFEALARQRLFELVVGEEVGFDLHVGYRRAVFGQNGKRAEPGGAAGNRLPRDLNCDQQAEAGFLLAEEPGVFEQLVRDPELERQLRLDLAQTARDLQGADLHIGKQDLHLPGVVALTNQSDPAVGGTLHCGGYCCSKATNPLRPSFGALVSKHRAHSGRKRDQSGRRW